MKGDEEMAQDNIKVVGAACTEGRKADIVVKIKDYINNNYVEAMIPRDDLTPKVVNTTIVNHNGICQNAKAICEGIKKEFDSRLREGKLNIYFFHKCLGWKKVEDEMVFYGNDAISISGKNISAYAGEADLRPKGNIETFCNMVNEQIVGMKDWSPLESIIAFGVGATVLAYANSAWGANLNNLMLHMMGTSTMGKSTALKLFIGMGSNPESKKGFWLIFRSTGGAIVKKIGNNNGVPVAIDEVRGGKKRDYEDLVYDIGNGEEKDRLKAGGGSLMQSVTFQTIVLTNGEVSLIKKCSNNEGVRARCVEFPNVFWTSSKQQSLAISDCMKRNYGLVTPLVAKELVENNTEWRERWEYWKKVVSERCEKDKIKLAVSGRIADFVALFSLAAEIFNAVLGLKLHVDKIFEFCYQYIIIANEDEGNMAAKVYDAILDYISRNKERFADATYYTGCRSMFNDISLSSLEDGFCHSVRKKIVAGKECDMVYVFRKGVLENVLADAGFSEIRICLFKLRQEGYLRTKDKNRSTYQYTINGINQNCVAVYVKDNMMQGINLEDDEEDL